MILPIGERWRIRGERGDFTLEELVTVERQADAKDGTYRKGDKYQDWQSAGYFFYWWQAARWLCGNAGPLSAEACDTLEALQALEVRILDEITRAAQALGQDAPAKPVVAPGRAIPVRAATDTGAPRKRERRARA
jgi:hypothetical protein